MTAALRIDVVSILPGYLDPLRLSLPGRAVTDGLVDLRVHDLRGWTHDRHRTVDDTPYGGGPGMVMGPEPWGEALEEVAEPGAVLVVPSPAGERFTQAVAAELAAEAHLVFACGRYEGIDQRVLDDAATRMRVRELSLGDYVVNGGEVAALAIIEAVLRLVPGFLGNPESAVTESHSDGLLEAPVFTRPPTWRGYDVPSVLLSGDHGAVEQWRTDQARRRTAARRPDLLAPAAVGEIVLRPGTLGHAGEILTVQRAAFVPLVARYPDGQVAELAETEADVRRWWADGAVLVAQSDQRLVGYGWAKERAGAWQIARLAVAPDQQGRGVGTALLTGLEALGEHLDGYRVHTGRGNVGALRFYRRARYRVRAEVAPGVVRLEKRRA